MFWSRFGWDARLRAEGFSLPGPGGGRTVPCTPGERSDAAVPSRVGKGKMLLTAQPAPESDMEKAFSSSVSNYRVSFPHSKKLEHCLNLKFTQIFQSSTIFLSCILLWDPRAQQHFCLNLGSINDAKGEAAGLLWCHPLSSKRYKRRDSCKIATKARKRWVTEPCGTIQKS